MALRIRLWQQGCKNRVCYRIVVAESRAPRDGKYVEAIGWYNPCGKAEKWLIHEDRLQHWLSVGAQLTPTVVAVAKKAAPTVMRDYHQRLEDRRTKQNVKRKARAAAS